MSDKSKKPQSEPAKKPATPPQKPGATPPMGKAATPPQPGKPVTPPTGEQKKPEPFARAEFGYCIDAIRPCNPLAQRMSQPTRSPQHARAVRHVYRALA